MSKVYNYVGPMIVGALHLAGSSNSINLDDYLTPIQTNIEHTIDIEDDPRLMSNDDLIDMGMEYAGNNLYLDTDERLHFTRVLTELKNRSHDGRLV